MINRRCRRCCCMNNNYYSQPNCNCKNNDNLEDSCNNICSPCQNYNDDCSCGFDDDEVNVFPTDPMLAQSYVPFQYMEDTYKPCVGLDNGTIFPELVSPYMPGDSMKQIAYIANTNKIGEGCNS